MSDEQVITIVQKYAVVGAAFDDSIELRRTSDTKLHSIMVVRVNAIASERRNDTGTIFECNLV